MSGQSPGKDVVGHGAAPLPQFFVETSGVRMAVSGVDILTELIAKGMACNPAALETWRDLVRKDLSFFSSPISEEIREEGRAQGRAEDILLVLEQRGLDVPDQARERITECGDTQIMRHWLARAVTAPTAEEIFEAA
ncbi:hypothetical protein [Streptomyces sp. KM273126]|uniref:hypothetical protein n=1 Tax=Streptomyces sp. KM273126 TaxID=2545247 RepID=UPI0026B9826E